jgi:hypothetical protein
MKMTTKYFLVLFSASFALAGCTTTINGGDWAKVKQWEYTAVDYGNADIGNVNAALNSSAAEGWILVAAVPIQSSNGENETRYIFKRPKH